MAGNRRRINGTSAEDLLRRVRVLFMVVYNDERSLGPLSIEMFHALGDILEGVSPNDLELRQINKAAFLKELASENNG